MFIWFLFFIFSISFRLKHALVPIAIMIFVEVRSSWGLLLFFGGEGRAGRGGGGGEVAGGGGC